MSKKNLQAMAPADHVDRVRNTVKAMQRIHDDTFTLTQFLIDATEAHCRALEEKYNGGEQWPPSGEGVLRRGARIAHPPSDSSRITPHSPEGEEHDPA